MELITKRTEVRITLTDGRVMMGVITAVDKDGNLMLADAYNTSHPEDKIQIATLARERLVKLEVPE